MKIYFFNPCRNGDIHVSRSFVVDIMDKLPDNIYYYIQNPNYTSHFVLKDIENLIPSYDIGSTNPNSSMTRVGDSVFINTWYGQSNFKYFDENSSANKSDYCSFYILYNIFINVYEFLGIKIETFDYYLPTIKYKNLELSKIDSFFQKKEFEKYILICDNPVLSGQSSNFNFKPIIYKLSEIHSKISFITTSDNPDSKENIFSTREIINLDFDLNEISYLSTKCCMIIGRSSGPYTFSLTKENLLDEKKKFVAFTNNKIVALGLDDGDYKCKLNWSNNYNYDKVLKKISEFI